MNLITNYEIFGVLGKERLSVRKIESKLKDMGLEGNYNTINKHLRKMVEREQLYREKNGKSYVYWNPIATGEVVLNYFY